MVFATRANVVLDRTWNRGHRRPNDGKQNKPEKSAEEKRRHRQERMNRLRSIATNIIFPQELHESSKRRARLLVGMGALTLSDLNQRIVQQSRFNRGPDQRRNGRLLLTHPAMFYGLESACYYYMKCEMDPHSWNGARANPPRAVSIPKDTTLKWELIRFALEVAYGLHDIPVDNNDNFVISKFEGRRFCRVTNTISDVALKQDDQIKMGDHLVIFRRMDGSYLKNVRPWVPVMYRKEGLDLIEKMQDGTLPEEDKISAIIAASQTNWSAPRHDREQAEMDGARPAHLDRVPPSYVCHRCGVQGEHSIKQCPTNEIPGYIPMSQKKNPHGLIPSQLREAITDEEIGRAPYFKNNRFYFRAD